MGKRESGNVSNGARDNKNTRLTTSIHLFSSELLQITLQKEKFGLHKLPRMNTPVHIYI